MITWIIFKSASIVCVLGALASGCNSKPHLASEAATVPSGTGDDASSGGIVGGVVGATASTAAPPKLARTFAVDGGTIEVEVQGDNDMIRFHRNGKMIYGGSACDRADAPYDTLLAYFQMLQTAVQKDERAAIARMVRYPLVVNTATKPGRTIADEGTFVKQYETIFTESVRKAIVETDAHTLFCRNLNQATIAHGTVWVEGNGGKILLTTVNAMGKPAATN